MSEIPADNTHDQHAVRRQKLAELRAAGIDPFRAEFETTHFSAEALRAYVEGKDNEVAVAVAGRLVTIRDMGKSQFVKILDQQGEIQLYVRKDVVGDEAYAAFRKLDLGDIIGAQGTLFRTKSGEVTVRVASAVMLAKALRPLPEKWHGLADPEQVYRQRYLDLVVNRESRRRLLLRSGVVSSIRRFLESRQFIEVETPVFQPVAGGAAAKPFTTHPTRSASTSSCASRWSSTSSGCSSPASTGCSRSAASSATRGFRANTTPSSPCWRSTRPTAATAA
jgi:lysyl-tRNA synthetase, class II